jgi:hypothetical protein
MVCSATMKDGFITEAKRRYKEIRSPVRCICLNQDIHFNADGFHHLVFTGLGKPRTLREVRFKARLIPLIVPVLRTADNASYEKRMVRESRRKGAPMMIAEFWGIEASVGKDPVSVRVIVKRVGDGRLFFWSVMLGRKSEEKQKTPLPYK